MNMSQNQAVAANYLTGTMRDRMTDRTAAKEHNEAVEEFVTRYPKHRLYRMAAKAPYRATKPGSLVLITGYSFETIKEAGEDPEEADCVEVVIIRTASEEWLNPFNPRNPGERFHIEPRYMERVNEEDYGLELGL